MLYDLALLGPTGFQDTAAALTVAAFGSGVEVMGAGRDGGRDLYLRGALSWTHTEDGLPVEQWNGYTVFQIKHKAEIAARPITNAQWLWGEIRKELDDWANPEAARGQVPDHLVFITNVALTPVPENGGHDSIYRLINDYVAAYRDDTRDLADDGRARKARLARLERIQHVRIWDGVKVRALLSVHDGVRRSVPAFLTVADVFANLSDYLDAAPSRDATAVLKSHARTTLLAEGSIYFDEAGAGEGTGIPVHEVAVDLPVTVSESDEASSWDFSQGPSGVEVLLEEPTSLGKVPTDVGCGHRADDAGADAGCIAQQQLLNHFDAQSGDTPSASSSLVAAGGPPLDDHGRHGSC